jgi:predicted nuclease of predicted toxin-antitoxin system
MKILADHCVYGKTVKILRDQGYQVLTLKELNKADANDPDVLALAQSLDAVLVTNDKGFGNILFYPPQHYGGIIVLRVTGANQERVHQLLVDALKTFDREGLRKALVVINASAYRVRRS